MNDTVSDPSVLSADRRAAIVAVAMSEFEDAEVVDAFLQLFCDAQETIDRGDSDVVVLASRRLPCMYEALVQAGMPPLRGVPVIGDHALDYIGPMGWARALVLDDTVILGSTLADLRKRLVHRAGVTEVVTRAVCQDSEQAAEYMLRYANTRAILVRPSHEVEAISVQIVRALYRQGVPLFSDFPTTNEVTLREEEWRSYLAQDGWLVADVTAPLLEDLGRSALVLVSTRTNRWKGFAGIPASVVSTVELVKIRAYVTPGDDGFVGVRLVPVGMLRPCAPEEITAAWGDLTVVLDLQEHDEWFQGLAIRAQQRLLQHLASVYFLFRAMQGPTGIAGVPAGIDLDPLALELSFGSSLPRVAALMDALSSLAGRPHDPAPSYPLVMSAPRPYPLLAEPELRRVMGEHQELVAEVGLPEKPRAGEIAKVGLAFAHAVASIFGFIVEEYEKPQREYLARLASMDAYDAAVADPARSRVLLSA